MPELPGVTVERLAALLLLVACGRIDFDRLDDGGTVSGRDVRVQRASTPMITPAVTVTIDPVDPAHTFVLCDVRTSDSDASISPTCELTGPTTVLVQIGKMSTPTVVGVQVVEIANATVERGSESFADAELSRIVPLTTTAGKFVILSTRNNYNANDADGAFAVTGHLQNPTALTLTRNVTRANTLDVAWQVVEVPGLAVYSSSMQIAPNDVGSVQSWPEAPGAFAYVMKRHTLDIEGEYLVRVSTFQDTVACARALVSAASAEAEFWIASSPDAHVQHGTTATTNQLVVDVPIETVDPDRTFVLTSLSGGRAGVGNDLDASLATATLSSPTNLQIQRAMGTAVGGQVSWYVVEW